MAALSLGDLLTPSVTPGDTVITFVPMEEAINQSFIPLSGVGREDEVGGLGGGGGGVGEGGRGNEG